MIRNRPLLLATALAVGFVAIDAALIYSGNPSAKKLDSIVTAEGQETPTVKVTRGSIEDVVTAQGTLEPKDYVDVGAQVSGQIKKLHVDIGDTVKSGDLIAEIDPQVYETKVKGDQAQLKTLTAQKLETEAKIAQAITKRDRNKKLLESNAVSRETFEDSQTDLDVAQAQLKSIKAQIEQAQSSLDGDRVNLGYTKIYAPMDGTVVDRSIKEGQTINASQTAPTIVQVANLDVMTVRAQVAEADIARLKDKMDVYFTTLGSGSRKWTATVRQVLPTPETVNDVVLYNVLVDVENSDHALMTGMTTQNFFTAGKADNVPVLPVTALGKRVPAKDDAAAGTTAYEVTKVNGGQTATTIVQVGLMDRKQAQIVSGLNEGDSVVPAQSTKSSASKTDTPGGPMTGPRL